jgi:hypothetical protein
VAVFGVDEASLTGNGMGGIDDCDLRSHHIAYRVDEEREMSAPEDQGVSPGVEKG